MSDNLRKQLTNQVEELISTKLDEIENKINEAVAEIERSGAEDIDGIDGALSILRDLSSDLY